MVHFYSYYVKIIHLEPLKKFLFENFEEMQNIALCIYLKDLNDTIEDLCTMLLKLHTIVEFRLPYISHVVTPKLLDAIFRKNSITSLSLSDASIKILCNLSFYIDKSETIENLDLYGLKMNPGNDHLSYEDLLAQLADPKLKNDQSNEYRELIQKIGASKTIKTLDLGGSLYVGKFVPKYLDSFCSGSVNLRVLRLSRCYFDLNSCVYLGKYLESAISIEEIYLTENNIDRTLLKYLIPGFKAAKQLTTICLGTNEIDDESAVDLVSKLENHSRLCELNLYRNGLTDEFVNWLLKRKDLDFSYLIIRGNPISQESQEILRRENVFSGCKWVRSLFKSHMSILTNCNFCFSKW